MAAIQIGENLRQPRLDGGTAAEVEWQERSSRLSRDEAWSDEFVFVRERAESPRHRALGGQGDAEDALGRQAVTVSADEDASWDEPQAAALVAPVLNLLDLEGQDPETGLLASYTSGRGELGVRSGFNITVNFEGTWTQDLQMKFVQAAEYLSTVIRGDLKDRPGIDDIAISATLSDIDDAGGVLGWAGPTATRRSQLPYEGMMEFDVADAGTYDRQGLFDDIVLHEMIHTLGFGTLWNRLDLNAGSVARGSMIFTGKNSGAALEALFPRIWDDQRPSKRGIAVETDGGPGTAGGHWDEGVFRNELMTGYINSRNYVSGLTVAALEDMGYNTIFNAAHAGRTMPQLDDIDLAWG